MIESRINPNVGNDSMNLINSETIIDNVSNDNNSNIINNDNDNNNNNVCENESEASMAKNIDSFSNYNATGFALTNMLEMKAIGYPNRVHLCKNEPLLMLYLCILRDKETKCEKFQKTTDKLLLLIFNQMINYRFIDGKNGNENSKKVNYDLNFNVNSLSSLSICDSFGLTFSKKRNYSAFSVSFMSLVAERGMYGVALDESSEHALEGVLSSFRPIIRSVVGTLKVEESFTQDQNGVIRSNRQAVALMPRDIGNRIIIVFKPVLVGNDLHSVIDALLKLGAKEKDIIIVCLIATRNSLILIVEKWQKVQIWIACIDQDLENNRIRPGIGSFKLRYKYVNHNSSNSRHTHHSYRSKKSKHSHRHHRHHKSARKSPSQSKNTQTNRQTYIKKKKKKKILFHIRSIYTKKKCSRLVRQNISENFYTK